MGLRKHRWVGGWWWGTLSQPGLRSVTGPQLGPACAPAAASVGAPCWSLPLSVRTILYPDDRMEASSWEHTLAMLPSRGSGLLIGDLLFVEQAGQGLGKKT